MKIEWKFLLFLWNIVFNVIRWEKPVNRWFSYIEGENNQKLFFALFLRPLGSVESLWLRYNVAMKRSLETRNIYNFSNEYFGKIMKKKFFFEFYSHVSLVLVSLTFIYFWKIYRVIPLTSVLVWICLQFTFKSLFLCFSLRKTVSRCKRDGLLNSETDIA